MTVSFRAAALLACMLLVAAPLAHAFGFADVEKLARDLAAAPFKPPEIRLSKSLRDLSYDHYRDIRYRPDRAIWRDAKLPFELMFFHQGFNFREPVRIHEVNASGVKDIPFSAALFDYGKTGLDPRKLEADGYAGFRVHYPLHGPQYKDEVIVFLGASYFRALGKSQIYGLSARGLAIDTGLSSGEEFPRFTEFWIERPDAAAKTLTIYALLDSKRVAGAYRFLLRPGVTTTVDVRSRLFLREQVSKLGIAPLTSMFFYGENQRNAQDDYRPEVHDSDGLSVASGTGEWIWRPLVNPRRLSFSSFALSNPLGFGLMQRDRAFGRYEDLEAHYERRPSAWVEPRGRWGNGRVELVQIPTPNEFNDNIVAYWVPATVPPPGQPIDFDYRLRWELEEPTRPPAAWVTQSRRGIGGNRGAGDGSIGYVVDFEGPMFAKLAPDATIESVVNVDANAQLLEQLAYRNEITGGARVVLRVKRLDDSKPVELRAFVRAGDAHSETWSYLLPPG